VVALGGLDALIFTAGIGENSPYVRRAICKHLGGVGLHINEKVNAVRVSEYLDVSGKDTKAKILVVPTNEELAIARDTIEIVK
ncbi:MAG: acetate kinase, partial [Oscillospiraceae bacterium]|nr:acetate kinase [Oscillospiraceae bacterium]